MIDKEESKRLHLDWWGKCRTCVFWGGTDENKNLRWNPGPCNNLKSKFYEKITWTEGYCEKWDSFDIDTAFEILEN